MNRRSLPTGIQDFATLRQSGCYYVDKTPLILKLVSEGRHYFLSRPRRFGKSLLLDTLRELFAGNESLFQGLHIHDHWDWNESHPVVRLSFDGKNNEPGNLEGNVRTQLMIAESNAGLDPAPDSMSGPDRLQYLLSRLHQSTGKQVVVLVDEYDKPILDVLDKPEQARANRDYLRGLYGTIKGSANLVRFVFVTGVSMFTKVSLFSGLNNLVNISLDPDFATICGYTDEDLDTVFAPELPGLDRDEIRRWYNGYHWRGTEKLYNPFDVLLLFRFREFTAHWFETGTPEFLYRLMVEREANPLELENKPISATRLTKFDVDDIDLRALMFQTGYLTIARETRKAVETFYTLEHPNLEVRASFSQGLLAHIGQDEAEASEQGHALLDLLAANNFDGFAGQLGAYLAGIPHQWRDSGDLGRYESHYAAMLYMTFRAIGADLRAEESTSRGRADMVLRHDGQIFVLEFKMVEPGENPDAALSRAIAQIRERGYAEKYRDNSGPIHLPIHLLGIVFSKEEVNLLAVRAEPY